MGPEEEMGWMSPKRAEPESSRRPSACCDGKSLDATRSQQGSCQGSS